LDVYHRLLHFPVEAGRNGKWRVKGGVEAVLVFIVILQHMLHAIGMVAYLDQMGEAESHMNDITHTGDLRKEF